MKKLLIVTSAIAMSCVLNAASFVWGFSSGEIVGPTDAYCVDGFLDGGYASLYIGDILVATALQDDVEFNFGTFDGSNPAFDDAVSSTAGQAYRLVLRTTDDKYEITYDGVSSSYDVVGMGTTTTIMSLVDTTTYGAADWQAVGGDTPTPGPIPEPTSGLLMLLGMAGLALRRKQK